MSTHYAITDTLGRVLRLVASETAPDVDAGQAAFLVGDRERGWPEAPFEGADLVVLEGALVWQDSRSIEQAKAHAALTIDETAGKARLRYITDVPGQQAVYLLKAEQARAYREAGYTGAVPPYIVAEADAIDDSAQVAADNILMLASLWSDQLSPEIERLRIGGKRLVSSATTKEEVQSTLDSTLSSLEAI